MACFHSRFVCIDLVSLKFVAFSEEFHDIETLLFFLEDACFARRLIAGEGRPLDYLLHCGWQLGVVNWASCNCRCDDGAVAGDFYLEPEKFGFKVT